MNWTLVVTAAIVCATINNIASKWFWHVYQGKPEPEEGKGEDGA